MQRVIISVTNTALPAIVSTSTTPQCVTIQSLIQHSLPSSQPSQHHNASPFSHQYSTPCHRISLHNNATGHHFSHRYGTSCHRLPTQHHNESPFQSPIQQSQVPSQFFICQFDLIKILVNKIQEHSQSSTCQLKCTNQLFSVFLSNITFKCDSDHVIQCESSALFGKHYEANIRSDMLKVHFCKFVRFLNLGTWNRKRLVKIEFPLAMTISALQTERVASALYEEMYKTQNVSEASGKDSIRIITDTRHAYRKTLHTDLVAIGQVTPKVVSIQYVT